MTNAKTEFLRHTAGKSNVKCAVVRNFDDEFEDERDVETFLKKDYSEEELDMFLSTIDYDYHSGYGGQELYGTIWYEDGTWSSRGEYDGMEWWEHHSCPNTPKGCE